MRDVDGLTATCEILPHAGAGRPRLVAVSASALFTGITNTCKPVLQEFLAESIDAEEVCAVLARLLRVRFSRKCSGTQEHP